MIHLSLRRHNGRAIPDQCLENHSAITLWKDSRLSQRRQLRKKGDSLVAAEITNSLTIFYFRMLILPVMLAVTGVNAGSHQFV